MLADWIAAPHVAVWWQSPADLDEVRAMYEPTVARTDPTEVFIVEADSLPIGMIQRYRLADYPEWEQIVPPGVSGGHLAGIDYLSSESHLGQGIGSEMISEFVALSLDLCPDVDSVVVTVNQGNRRSRRGLEKAGFLRFWAGTLGSDDPNDHAPSSLYVRHCSRSSMP